MMNKVRKFMAKTLVGVVLTTTLLGSSVTAFAAEPTAVVESTEVTETTEISETEATEVVETETTEVSETEATEVSETEATEVVETEATEVSETEATEVVETETTEVSETDTTEAETNSSIEDLLGEVDNTQDVVEDTVYAELTLIVPENTVISKDGVALTSFEADVMLTDGQLVLSQPTAMEYKNRIESDVLVNIAEGKVSVVFEGAEVQGTVSDALENTISFDGKTLQIINSDKMEDSLPSEEEEDKPEEPEENPADYTVRYFVNSVADENLLHKDVITGIEGETIDIASINLNAYKPENTESLTWLDGVMQDGYATVITSDDTDIIDIVYVSETVVIDADADFTVKYYKDALQEGNYLGEYKQGGNAGEGIDYSSIDVNKFQPESYGNGEIQTVVSAQTVTSDDSDVVYVLYTRIEKELQVVTETIEVPVEKIVEKEVRVEVPVEKIITVEVPGETVYVEVPGETQVVEKIVEVPVETVVTDTVYVPVEVEKLVEVEKTVEVEKVVEVPGETETVYIEVPKTEVQEVEKVVEVEVPVYVEVPSEESDTDTAITPEENPDPEMDEDTPINPEDGPQTGDVAPITVLLIIMLLAGFGMVVMKKRA